MKFCPQILEKSCYFIILFWFSVWVFFFLLIASLSHQFKHFPHQIKFENIIKTFNYQEHVNIRDNHLKKTPQTEDGIRKNLIIKEKKKAQCRRYSRTKLYYIYIYIYIYIHIYIYEEVGSCHYIIYSR